MKKTLVLAFALLLCLLLPACAEEEELLLNGDFSEANRLDPAYWEKDMWLEQQGVSVLGLVNEGREGPCVYIRNDAANDARYAQTVSVEPNTLYRLSAWCRAAHVDEAGIGANLSVASTYDHSEELRDTGGAWQELVLYGRTGPDVRQLTVYLRLGGYSGETTGEAWFDDASLVRVDSAPEGAVICDFTPIGGSSQGTPVDENAEPGRNTEAWLLLICLWLLAVLAAARKNGRNGEAHVLSRSFAFWLMLAGAVALRVVMAALVPGYNTDINCFTSWANTMAEAGPAHFYSAAGWCDYPPLYMLMLWPVGALQNALGLYMRHPLQLVILKGWPIVFDALSAILVWRLSRKKLGGSAAFLLSLFFALDPAIFVDSAAWGQIDSVFTLMLVLCALLAADDRTVGSLLCFTAAMLAKPQALLFAPLGLMAVILFTVRKARRIKRPGLAVGKLLIGLAAAFGLLHVTAMLCCDTATGDIVERSIRAISWLWELYSGTMQGYSYVTVNALNLYIPFGLNWARTSEHMGPTLLAWILFAHAYLYCGFLLVKSRRNHDLLLIGGTLIVLIFTFGPMIHERYIYPAVLLLLMSYIHSRDKRLLIALSVLSATLFLNEVLVLQGGMTQANFGHLQTAENWLNIPLSLLNVLNALYLCYLALDICVLRHTFPYTPCPAGSVPVEQRRLLEPADYRLHLRAKDWLLMLGITLAYAALTFSNLGSTKAPQTTWISGSAGEEVVFDLGEVRRFRMTYYGNICNTHFTVALSNDGETWTEPCDAEYDQGSIFRWIWFVPRDASGNTLSGLTQPAEDGRAFMAYAGYEGESYPFQTARYISLTAVDAGLKLSEVGFIDEEGKPWPIRSVKHSGEVTVSDAALLMDEQDTIPAAPSWYNSTYFDEIYHARTAYEHLHGLGTYEWTHPPLGKVLMMVGISRFGMTPFGWRFMGALMGVLMLPLLYLIVKQLTHKWYYASIATALLALDSMHFTQTRIATIDSYAVFWIMLMYLFMFRFCQMPWHKKGDFPRSLLPLGLCGVSMGCAWATKWIGIYASVGLLALFVFSLVRRHREAACAKRLRAQEEMREKIPETAARRYGGRVVLTLLFCLGTFVVLPLLIYYFSYFWHLRSEGVVTLLDMFDGAQVKRVVELQRSILNYHAGLAGDTHFFRSPWYQWPVIWWPMWYYSGKGLVPDDMVSSISCMGNPAVWWFGLIALLFILFRAAWARRANNAYTLVLIGFASQFLPWVLVPRSTFIYHYFASVPFLIMATVLFLAWMRGHSHGLFRGVTIGLLVSAAVLFAAFYPLEAGVTVSYDYALHLRWFKWYNFALK